MRNSRRGISAAAVALATGALLLPAIAQAAPVNDAFANPAPLLGSPAEIEATNFAATKEPGEPSHVGDPGGASVWFAWTAPRAAQVLLQSCTFGWRGLTAVYRGNSLGSLELVASSSPLPGEACREVRFHATGATTYRIVLDGYTDGGTESPQQGEYRLALHEYTLLAPGEPTNDAFAAATVLEPREFAFFGGSTEGATREAGEPGHGGDLAGASVWYRWTAPRSMQMKVFPCRGSFHPVVSVWAGAEIGSVTPVGVAAAPDPSSPPCQLGGLGGVVFDAVAGTTYSISVDGANGEWGGYSVNMQMSWPPPGDFVAPLTYIRKRIGIHGRQAKIRFFSNEPGGTFLCRRDKQPSFKPCASPKTYANLAFGRHRFLVKAVDPFGNVDTSPAIRTFTMAKR